MTLISLLLCAFRVIYSTTKRENTFLGGTTMKEIKAFEDAIKQGNGSLKELGINATLFWAYRNSKESGNDLIDFSEVIWDYDIAEIAQTLKENNITEFTISSTFSSLIETLAAFEEHGISMAGLTKVRARYTDWKTGEHALIPAIKMTVKEA